jgi:hypothetical protein
MHMKRHFVILSLALFGTCTCHGAAGPSLTDSNLFAALDLNYPGLASVQASVNGGDYRVAKANLAAYLRVRTNVTWWFDPHNVVTNLIYDRVDADCTVTGSVTVVGIPYAFPNSDIDWFYNITTDTNYTYSPNNEWQWQLNRMDFWPNLGSAYWGTSDETYARAWVSQLADWLTSCPPPTSMELDAGSPWRPLEAGIRMLGNWPNTYHRFLLSQSFTDDDLCDYLKSCIEHARYLRAYSYPVHNWMTFEMLGLYTVGALYPELNEAEDWRAFASQQMYSWQTNDFYPDGVEIEMSPGYQGSVVKNIASIQTLAKLENRFSELPGNYVANMESAYAHYLWLMAPDRMLPEFNDSGSVDSRLMLSNGYSLYPNRSDFLWVISDGASGSPPAQASCSYPWAGYKVMRSGWSTTDNYLCFAPGPIGVAHTHADKLNVVLWSYGRQILFDSGTGNYDASVWRDYEVQSFSHNTVIVDGQSQLTEEDRQAQTPLAMPWESNSNFDFAVGNYDSGYGSLTNRPYKHTRRVLFAKPDIYVVADTLAANDASSHSVEARWHLLPTEVYMDPVTKVVVTTNASMPNLAVVPCFLTNLVVGAYIAQTNPVLLGWKVVSGQPGYVPATTVTHTLFGTGTKQFLTLLLPLPIGASNPVKKVTSSDAASASVELNDGRKLLVHADPNPARDLEFTEILADNSTNRHFSAGLRQPTIVVSTGSGGRITLAWPLEAGLFQLYEATSLLPPVAWTRTTNTPGYSNGQWVVSLVATNGSRFFRMQTW